MGSEKREEEWEWEGEEGEEAEWEGAVRQQEMGGTATAIGEPITAAASSGTNGQKAWEELDMWNV